METVYGLLEAESSHPLVAHPPASPRAPPSHSRGAPEYMDAYAAAYDPRPVRARPPCSKGIRVGIRVGTSARLFCSPVGGSPAEDAAFPSLFVMETVYGLLEAESSHPLVAHPPASPRAPPSHSRGAPEYMDAYAAAYDPRPVRARPPGSKGIRVGIRVGTSARLVPPRTHCAPASRPCRPRPPGLPLPAQRTGRLRSTRSLCRAGRRWRRARVACAVAAAPSRMLPPPACALQRRQISQTARRLDRALALRATPRCGTQTPRLLTCPTASPPGPGPAAGEGASPAAAPPRSWVPVRSPAAPTASAAALRATGRPLEPVVGLGVRQGLAIGGTAADDGSRRMPKLTASATMWPSLARM